jgi:hypothetical protein
MSPSIITKLALLSILSLAPVLGRDYLRSWLSSSAPLPLEPTEIIESEERVTRWAWVREWRSKVRVPSRSRSRRSSEDDAQADRHEKEESLS